MLRLNFYPMVSAHLYPQLLKMLLIYNSIPLVPNMELEPEEGFPKPQRKKKDH